MLRLRFVPRLTTHLTAASVLILTMGAPAYAVPIMINNGLGPPTPENVIDASDDYSGDPVFVRNVGCPPGWPAVFPGEPCPSPGGVTEVEIVSGGSVPDRMYVFDSSTVTMTGGTVSHNMIVYDSSTFTMTGGTVDYLYVYDSSTVTMTGGQGGALGAYDDSAVAMNGGLVGTLSFRGSSTITMTGGTVSLWLSGMDTSTITMNGGSVAGDLRAEGTSTITMNGGSVAGDLRAYDFSVITLNDAQVVGYLSADDSSRVTINRGAVVDDLRAYGTSNITMRGGTVGDDLEAYGSSNIVLVGRRFMVDGVPVPYGDLTALTGTLTGRLANGGSLNNLFYQGGYAGSCTGTITLVEAPEIPVPALQLPGLVGLVASLLGFGLVGLAAGGRRRVL